MRQRVDKIVADSVRELILMNALINRTLSGFKSPRDRGISPKNLLPGTSTSSKSNGTPKNDTKNEGMEKVNGNTPTNKNHSEQTRNHLVNSRNDNNGKSSTFKPRQAVSPRTQSVNNIKTKTLGSGYIRHAVELPPGENLEEWIAMHCIDFFNAVSLLVGIVHDESAPQLPPGAGFPPGFEYLWADPISKRTIKCSGPAYIEYVMNWIEACLNDPRIFPSSSSQHYPRDFVKNCKGIFKRMFRIFAILYTHFYHRVDALGSVAHLNTTFKHYLFFCFEFDLIPSCELEAIEMIVIRLKEEYERQGKGPNNRNRGIVLERGDAGNISYIRYNNEPELTTSNPQEMSTSSAP